MALRSIHCITKDEIVIPCHDMHCTRIHENLLISHRDRIAKDLHDKLLESLVVLCQELCGTIVRQYLHEAVRGSYEGLNHLAMMCVLVELEDQSVSIFERQSVTYLHVSHGS